MKFRSLKNAGIIAGFIVFIAILVFYNPQPGQPEISRMAAIAALMAILWITEAVPLATTALIPVVAFPLSGILDGGEVAKAYINSIIFLFIGGFLIALSMERWNLHRRIALNIIYAIGKRADLLVLGFMVACGFLSMWISNTATAVMMLPVGMAVITKMEEEFGREESHRITLALMLGIAYGCTIGGVSTLVGTPPNLAFIRIMQETFPDAPPITFGNWIIMGIPYSFTLLIITWFMLTHVLVRIDKSLTLDRSILRDELKKLGPIRFEEKAVLVVFSCTVLLWIFRRDLNLGIFTLPGWSGLWQGFSHVDDGTIAVAMALVLFFIPASANQKAQRILEMDVFARLPWGIILLFGGGFALASGFASSGLSLQIGESFRALGDIPIPVLLLIICLSVTFLTELTSNVATITMLLPILAAWAASLGLHPMLFAIPATISASMAFMMPVATPPNAVVFGSQRIRIIEMARTGLALNLIAVILTLLAVYIFFPLVTGAQFGTFPDWASHLR